MSTVAEGKRSNWVARPRVAATLRIAGTVAAVVFVGFFDAVFAVIPTNTPLTHWSYAWHVVGTFAAFAAGVSMIWRARAPQMVFVANAVGALVLPLGPFGTAGALTWVIGTCGTRVLYWAIPLGTVSITAPFIRDYFAEVPGVVLSTGDNPGPSVQLQFGAYVVIWLTFLATTIAIGFARRWRRQAAMEAQSALDNHIRIGALEDQLGRQEERELIAREMHDTVAHHLSIVSLRAAALEMTAVDPAVPESARAVRESAHQALEEMRVLIGTLRATEEGPYAGASPTLDSIRKLVGDASEAGVMVGANLQFPPDAGVVPNAVARAAYRIVQESITNALKHAPGSGIGVDVSAEPGHGVAVSVTNWLPPASVDRALSVGDSHSGGNGIRGMRERVESVGGSLIVGPQEQRWVVQAWLPWEGTQG